jgi:hypothetical protein
MIPNLDILQEQFTEFEYGDETYKLNISEDNTYIRGKVNELDAVKQSIYLILNTERYAYNIYSWNYGVELADLIGQPLAYITVVLPNRIKDALIQDNRIKGVRDFIYKPYKNKLHVTFTVVTTLGDIDSELEVII